MGTGIIVCGLNGAGTSTLGKALARELGFYFIDNETLYFPKESPDYPYFSPRSREEVKQSLMQDIQAHDNFVFAAVKGDCGEGIYPLFQYAVLMDVPKDIRMRRVRDRSFMKFGHRILPGGDLYEQEEKFFELVQSREADTVEEWVRSLSCPVIRVDGTKPVEANVRFIIERIRC